MYTVLHQSEFLAYAPIYKMNSPEVEEQIEAMCQDKSIVFIVVNEREWELTPIRSTDMIIFDGYTDKHLSGPNVNVLLRLLELREQSLMSARRLNKDAVSVASRVLETKVVIQGPPPRAPETTGGILFNLFRKVDV